MLKSGITKRWIVSTLLVITCILVLISAAASVLIRDYYYDTVENRLKLMGQSSTLADYFGAYTGASSDTFASRAQEYVENFSDSNIAEVWIINRAGEVIFTSTGFISETDAVEEYSDAIASPSGSAYWTGRMSSGEKVMAFTSLLPKSDNVNNGAVRYIISLEGIDEQMNRVIVLIALIALFSLFLVIASGMFFIRSIVDPVKKLNEAAREIAAGKYSSKVSVSNRFDEIAELSDSINYMTNEIEKTDKMKNDFISTVSHELRTPLTAIKGWGETLLSLNETTEDQTLKDGLEVILTETDRLYALVEDLLDFSKIENSRLVLRLKKLDLLAELEDALFSLKVRSARADVKLLYDIPDFVAMVYADPDRIKQVFVNIIDNAIKYTPSGGTVKVSATEDGKNVCIVFADSGCGIAPEDLPHVKEKFFKANLSEKGSGIGLAVSDEIVKLHNGQLDIASVLGEGTKVSISLPLADKDGSGKDHIK